MIRSMVCAALLVCRVEKIRCPVSAAVSTVWTVVRSRISPTMTTSGSCRNTLRSASAKLGVSVPTSRWVTAPRLSFRRNSIGSSMVTRCTRRVSAMSRSSAASVEDLPEPVGPVIRTRPCGSWANSDSTGGSPQSSSDGKSNGTRRNTADTVLRCWKTEARNRDTPERLYPKSAENRSSRALRCVSVRMDRIISRIRSGWSGSVLRGRSLPWMRTSGGRIGFKWRSEACCLTMNRSRSSIFMATTLSTGFSRGRTRLSRRDQHKCRKRRSQSGLTSFARVGYNPRPASLATAASRRVGPGKGGAGARRGEDPPSRRGLDRRGRPGEPS
jgi:hypothetical protein